MTRKICVVTGSRAEYGLLRWIMEGVRESSRLELQVVVTGMHLSPRFGHTYRDIELDGFSIDRKVEMLLSSDTPAGLAKSMGLGLIGFGDVLSQLKPDLLLVLGDRFEIFSAVAAATVACIPVAHLHGGETSEGAFDEAIRHSITKMSHLHFVAANEYRNRVIQLGEHPDRVFVVGGLGVDSIRKLKLLESAELEASLGFKLGSKNLVVTFHPATLEAAASSEQMVELLVALDALKDTQLIFTMPNADTGGQVLFDMIDGFVDCHENARAFTSLGQARYLSCVKYADGVIGNSSSGLAEVPSLKKGTINIGDRQRGRLKADSVIDCDANRNSIASAIQKLYSSEFQMKLATVSNPYGDGHATEKTLKVIKDYPLEGIVKKSFHDIASDRKPEDSLAAGVLKNDR